MVSIRTELDDRTLSWCGRIRIDWCEGEKKTNTIFSELLSEKELALDDLVNSQFIQIAKRKKRKNYGKINKK